jgi:hypothetical protein
LTFVFLVNRRDPLQANQKDMPFEAIGAPIRAKGGQKTHIAAQFTVICAPIEGIGGPMSVVGAPEMAGGGQLGVIGGDKVATLPTANRNAHL